MKYATSPKCNIHTQEMQPKEQLVDWVTHVLFVAMYRSFLTLCKVLVLVLICKEAQGQEEPYKAPQGLNNWYLEAGGPAIFYSLNYEKYLYRTSDEKYTWCAHVGAGYNPFDFNILNAAYLAKNSFMFPFSTCLLKGAGKEKLEAGAGFTLITQDFKDRDIYPHSLLGLRVMESNRVCLRLNYVLVFRPAGLAHWIGISLGKNF